jgi:ABC-type amino acid transport substrate-binding protein
MDAELAGELARRLNRPLQIVWADTLDEGLLSPVVRPDGGADMAVGVPVEPATVEDSMYVGRQVLYSLPYAATGYVLVTGKDHTSVSDLKSVGRGVIGVEVGSVAASQLWDRGYLLRRFGDQDRILEALASGDLEYGVLWGNSGWMIEQDRAFQDALTLQHAEIDMLKPRWNVAVAVGRHNRTLLPVLDGVILAMKQDGYFKALYKKYHIPYFDPFEEGSPNP